MSPLLSPESEMSRPKATNLPRAELFSGLTLIYLVPVALSAPGFLTAKGFNSFVGPISLDVWLATLLLAITHGKSLRRSLYLVVALLVVFDLALFLPPGVSVRDVFETGLKSAHSIALWKLISFLLTAVVCIYAGTEGTRRVAHSRLSARVLAVCVAGLILATATQAAVQKFGGNSRIARSALLSAGRLAWREPDTLLIKRNRPVIPS